MPLKILSEPHPHSAPLQNRLLICIVFSTFVFLFLWVFQPFGLSSLPKGIMQVAFGYGAVCFTLMFLLNIVIIEAFRKSFREERWTLAKELLWIILNTLLIGLGNAVYTSYVLGWGLNTNVLVTFELYTVAIGVIPSSVMIVFTHKRMNTKYAHEAEQLNNKITPKEPHHNNLITIQSENKGEKLSLDADNILFINSAENYIEVHFLQKGLVQKKVLRNTLKQVEEDTKEFGSLMRCHRGYIVNTDKVKKISGNAQGYKLHFNQTDALVPVSRSLSSQLKEKLQAK